MAIEITVEHGEMDGYPQERRTALRFEATRKLECAWSDRHTLCAQALAFPGHIYPYSTGSWVNAYCESASIQAFGKVDDDAGETKQASYEKAIVTLKYATPGRDTPQSTHRAIGAGGVQYIETFESTFENIILPHSKFRWGSGDDAEVLEPDEAPAKMVVGWEYTRRILNTPYISPDIGRLLGHVNSPGTTTNLSRLWFEEETLLLGGASVERTSQHLGGDRQTRWDIVLHFLFRADTWNKFPHTVGTGGVTDFKEIYLLEGSSAHKIYPTGNFAPLMS